MTAAWPVLLGTAAGLAPCAGMSLTSWYYRPGGGWYRRQMRRLAAAQTTTRAAR